MDNVRPYSTGGSWHICTLHDLDIIDKHRLILPVQKLTTIAGIVVEDENGMVSGDSWPISGNELYLDFHLNVQIKNKGKPSVRVCFAEGLATESLEVVSELAAFSRVVISVVKTLESAL